MTKSIGGVEQRDVAEFGARYGAGDASRLRARTNRAVPSYPESTQSSDTESGARDETFLCGCRFADDFAAEVSVRTPKSRRVMRGSTPGTVASLANDVSNLSISNRKPKAVGT